MKKIVFCVALCLTVLLLTLTGCGSSGNVPAASQAVSSEVKPVSSVQASSENSAEEISASQTEKLVDEMRKEFKDFIDSYEDFMDEYCVFMEKYQADPTDGSLLGEYPTFLEKYNNFINDLEKWKDGDLNEAELKYMLEVTTRVEQKTAEIALTLQ